MELLQNRVVSIIIKTGRPRVDLRCRKCNKFLARFKHAVHLEIQCTDCKNFTVYNSNPIGY